MGGYNPLREEKMQYSCTCALIIIWLSPLIVSTDASVVNVELPSVRDNTLYESATGALSNGAGEHFLAGRTAQTPPNSIRRGLIRFDIAGNIPPGSTIDSVSLTLHCSSATPGAQDVGLHRVPADWGEGNSDAPGSEGSGTTAAPGDATWLHRFSPSVFWGSAGGDFSATASATASVDATDASYGWGSTTAMAADVQEWLDNPAGNFGWMLIGNESTASTAKRFDTRENLTPEFRPVLAVTFTLPPLPGDANCDGVVSDADIPLMVQALIDPSGYTACDITRADANTDGQVNGRDVQAFVQSLL